MLRNVVLGGVRSPSDCQAVLEEKYRYVCWVAWLFVLSAVIAIVSGVKSVRNGDDTNVYILGAMCTSTALAVFAYVQLMVTKGVSPYITSVICCLSITLIFIADFGSNATSSGRLWPLLCGVLAFLSDINMVKTKKTATVVVIFWMILLRLDQMIDLNFHSVPGIPDRERRAEVLCGCTSPPCTEVEWNFALLVVEVCVVLLFSLRPSVVVEAPSESVQQGPTESLAEILRCALDNDYSTSWELLESFAVTFPEEGQVLELLENVVHQLSDVHSFIPEFDDVPSSPTHSASRPMGFAPATLLDSSMVQDITILFTDIKGSTKLWELAPIAMKKALMTHNSIIRTHIAARSGYEVKTIGDSFMVAFEHFSVAVNFALNLQVSLNSADWGRTFQGLPSDGDAQHPQHWQGLLLRIGVHHGPCTCQSNQLTGRDDFFGPAVNKASRLESQGRPGFVSISSEEYLDCNESLVPHFNALEEAVALRGISENFEISHLVPAALRGRMSILDKVNPVTPGATEVAMNQSSYGKKCDLSESHGRGRLTSDLEVVKNCTIGAVRMRLVQHSDLTDHEGVASTELNLVLSLVLTFLDRTGGKPLTFSGNVFSIGWHVTRSCRSHVENGLRFAQFCFSSPREVTVGLCRGSCLTGMVGCMKHHYLGVFGTAFSLAVQLAMLGEGMGLRALFVSLFGVSSSLPTGWSPMRPIMLIDAGEPNNFTVFELDLSTQTHRKRRRRSCSDSRWEWSQEYWNAFAQKDHKTIHKAGLEGDDMLVTVAEALRCGQVTRVYV